MATIPKKMAATALLSNAASTKYTCPGATTAVIRHIHVMNPTGSAVTFTMSIGLDAAATRIFGALSIPANSERSFWGPYTLNAGDVIQALAGTTNVITLTIDGQEIT